MPKRKNNCSGQVATGETMLLSRNLSEEMSQKLFNDYCSLPQVATWVADNAVFYCVLVLLAVLSLYVWTMCANGYVYVCLFA